jgi:hydrophobe/amphiphile efflux-3 (HAE3) family protein
MERFWSQLGFQLGKKAGLVSLVGLVITLVLGFGITKLEFATGQDSYLNDDDQVAIDNVAYQDLFGGQAMISLVTMDEGAELEDLFTPENLETWAAVEEELRSSGRFEAVVSPVTAITFTNNLVLPRGAPERDADGNLVALGEVDLEGSPAASIAGGILVGAAARDTDGAAARNESSAVTLTRITAIAPEDRVIGNPEWNSFLIYDNEGDIRKALRPFFPDEQHAQMVVRLPGNTDIDTEGEAAAVVEEATEALQFEGATVTTTGAPILLRDLNDYLTGGMLMLGAIAVGFMIIILLVFFDVRWRLLPLGVILVALIWAFGLAGYLGIPLTIVTIAGLPVMLGIGIDYAIQVHARVEEEVIIDRDPHPIQETARNLGPALLVVTFDAVFAFLALRFAAVPMIRDFGLLLAVGIVAICVCSIVLPISILGIREYKSPTKGRDFSEGPLGRLVMWLGSLPPKFAPAFFVVSMVIFFVGLSVESKLTLQTDPVEWVNQDTQVIKDIQTLESEVGSSSELGIFVQSDDIFSDETVTFVHDFIYEQLETYPGTEPGGLMTASSVVSTVSFLMEIPGATIIPPTGEEVELAYLAAPADIQASVADLPAGALNIIFRTAAGDLEERAVVVNAVRDNVDPPEGISATPSGLAVVGVGLLENLEKNRVALTYIAIAFVGIFLAVRLRSIVRSLLSLVPVLIAVGAASIVAYAFDLKLSPMTAVGGPIVVAICTEFTSLILLRFVEERRRGLAPKEAADVAAHRTGRAFIVSAMTGITGVAVIALSSLPVLRDFGAIVAMNVFVALLSALVILPPMLIWADESGREWVSRGMVKPPKETGPAAAGDVPAPETI